MPLTSHPDVDEIWLMDWNSDFLLANPIVLRQCLRDIDEVEAIRTCADLKKYVGRNSHLSDLVMDYIWRESQTSDLSHVLGTEDLHLDAVALNTPGELLAALPDDAVISLKNATDDGHHRFINAFDPRQLGVPDLLVDQFCEELDYIDGGGWGIKWDSGNLEDLRLFLEKNGIALVAVGMDAFGSLFN